MIQTEFTHTIISNLHSEINLPQSSTISQQNISEAEFLRNYQLYLRSIQIKIQEQQFLNQFAENKKPLPKLEVQDEKVNEGIEIKTEGTHLELKQQYLDTQQLHFRLHQQKNYEYINCKSKPYKKSKNQTKNIPKNYGKAIVSFIQKNQPIVRKVLVSFPDIEYQRYMLDMKKRRKSINSIADLRALWLKQQCEFSAPTRILSMLFLRRYCLRYIFNSRITTFDQHIKYRERMIQVLKRPQLFKNIKIY